MTSTRIFPMFTLLLVAMLATPATADQPDLDTVVKRAAAAWSKHKSMTAKISMSTNVQASRSVVSGFGSGKLECLRQGDKTLLRTDSSITFSRIRGEDQKSQEQQMHSISDGEYTYVLTSLMGRRQAMKIPADPRAHVAPQILVDAMKQEGELELLPNEKLNGHDVYVIEVTLNNVPPNGVARRVLRFDQEKGFLRQLIAYNAEGNPMSTVTYSDVKFDVDLDPRRFEFQLPEGVQLMDRTKP